MCALIGPACYHVVYSFVKFLLWVRFANCPPGCNSSGGGVMSTCGELEKTSLHHHQHHLKLFRAPQFSNRIQRRNCLNVVSEWSLLSSRHPTVLLDGYTIDLPNYELAESGRHKIFCNVRFSITFRSTLRSLNVLEIRFRTEITLTCALLHACYTYRSAHPLRLY